MRANILNFEVQQKIIIMIKMCRLVKRCTATKKIQEKIPKRFSLFRYKQPTLRVSYLI